MYLIVCGINTMNNEITAIVKRIIASLYLLVYASIKLARVVRSIKKIIFMYLFVSIVELYRCFKISKIKIIYNIHQ